MPPPRPRRSGSTPTACRRHRGRRHRHRRHRHRDRPRAEAAQAPGCWSMASSRPRAPCSTATSPGRMASRGSVPGFCPGRARDRTALDAVLTVSEREAIAAARRCARLEGIPIGISSGAALHAALALARKPGAGGSADRRDRPLVCRAVSFYVPVCGARRKARGLCPWTPPKAGLGNRLQDGFQGPRPLAGPGQSPGLLST